MLSQKSSSISPHNKDFFNEDLSNDEIRVIKPYSLPDTDSEFDKDPTNPANINRDSQNLVLEVMEIPTLRAQVSRSEDTGT